MTARGSTDRRQPRGSAARRLAARIRRRRLVAVRPLLLAAAGCAVAGLAAWALLGSSLLGVHRVTAAGTRRLAPATVLGAARVPGHHPLATLDTAAIARRVAALPAVATVHVVRDWPRTVRVVVTERVAVAVVAHGDGYRLVDAGGVPFWPVASRPPRLPLLQVRAAASGDPATRAALAVLAALPQQVRRQVSTIEAPTPAKVELLLRRGRAVKTVVWGTPGDGIRKAAVLAALLRRPGHVYDVSTPSIATIR
ncbi:MAG: cell division protein FtsQ/DivIB [Frankiaceae bacterium]